MLTNAPVTATLTADDIDRAKKFYTEKLGLKQSSMVPDSSSDVLFEAGQGTYIYIYSRPGSRPENTVAGFNVTDLVAEMGELRSKGVVFEDYDMPDLKTENGIATMDGVKAAWFKDSEGNIISVMQR